MRRQDVSLLQEAKMWFCCRQLFPQRHTSDRPNQFLDLYPSIFLGNNRIVTDIHQKHKFRSDFINSLKLVHPYNYEISESFIENRLSNA